jgi:hypothetical protein
MLIAGGDGEVLPGGVQDLLDVQFIKRPGEAKAPPGPPDRGYYSRFPQFEKNLLQKNGRNIFHFG